jgi:hypothetical protein
MVLGYILHTIAIPCSSYQPLFSARKLGIYYENNWKTMVWKIEHRYGTLLVIFYSTI